MKHFTKGIALALVLALSAVLLAGCGSKSSTSGSDSPLTIGDYEINYNLYRYLFLNMKAEMDGGDANYWTGTAASSGATSGSSSASTEKHTEAELKTYVEEYLKGDCAMRDLAKANNCTLTDEDYAKVDASIATAISNMGGDEAYDKALASIYATREGYRKLLAGSLLQSKLIAALYGEKLVENATENYVHAKHVLIAFDEKATDAEADKADKLKEAQEVLQKAKSGEDFDQLIKTYNDDPGMTSSPDGYYFTAGQMVEPFEKAAFAMKVGEISDIVETSYGYHILQKLDISADYVKSNPGNFITQELYTDLESKLKEAGEKLKVKYSAGYDKLGIATIS